MCKPEPEAAPEALRPRARRPRSTWNEGEPQLAEVEAGKTFLIYDVSKVTRRRLRRSPRSAEPVVAGMAQGGGRQEGQGRRGPGA